MKLSNRNKLGLNFLQNSRVEEAGGKAPPGSSSGKGVSEGYIKRPLRAFKGAPDTPRG